MEFGPHFTYVHCSPEQDLCQGDVLDVTDDLRKILQPAFQHIGDLSECSRFAVITQTCDLTRRKRRGSPHPSCKATYISLAAMRPLRVVLSWEVSRYQKDDIERLNHLCREEHLPKVERFVERLLNNNEEGYFYFHETLDLRVPEPMCAVLPELIALKVDHYEVCRAARVIGLKPEFQAKLGWLVGYSYSQVATEDWVPRTVRASQFRRMVQDVARLNYSWADGISMRELKTAIQQGKVAASQAAITEFLLKQTLPRTDQLLDLIRSTLRKAPEFVGQPHRVEALVQQVAKAREFDMLMRIEESAT